MWNRKIKERIEEVYHLFMEYKKTNSNLIEVESKCYFQLRDLVKNKMDNFFSISQDIINSVNNLQECFKRHLDIYQNDRIEIYKKIEEIEKHLRFRKLN